MKRVTLSNGDKIVKEKKIKKKESYLKERGYKILNYFE